jgi:hypothetical protein
VVEVQLNMQLQDVAGQRLPDLHNYFHMERMRFHGMENGSSRLVLHLRDVLVEILLHGHRTEFPGMHILPLKLSHLGNGGSLLEVVLAHLLHYPRMDAYGQMSVDRPYYFRI